MKSTVYSFSDVDEFLGLGRSLGWQGELVQTEVGKLRVDMSLHQSPGVVAARTRHSVANAREIVTPADARTFGLVVPESDGNSWCQHRFDEVVVQMMPRGDYAAANPAGHLGYQLAFSDEQVAEVCAQLDVRAPLDDDACLLQLNDTQLDRTLELLTDLFDVDCDLAQVQAGDELLATFIRSFNSGCVSATRTRAAQRQRAFRAAREYLHAHLDDAITLADVARHANASRRTLTKAFQEALGVGPMSYLKLLRLNRVQQALRRPASAGVQIVDVANANGFWHMGQLASDYRRLFGELPSATRQSCIKPNP